MHNESPDDLPAPPTEPRTPEASEGADDTREKLMQAATKLFADQGFEGTSVKELAQLAGVNVSLVSYHFGGKEGLLRTCLERFGKKGLGIAKRVLKEPTSAEEFKLRLKMFIEEIYETHTIEPDICRILHREMDMKKSIAEDVFNNTFHKVFEAMAAFLDAAKKNGLLRKDLETPIATMLIMGATIHPARVARQCHQNFGTSIHEHPFREQVIEHLLTLFTIGFGTAREGSAGAGSAKASKS
jgi:AcrR family transcriptional regulator